MFFQPFDGYGEYVRRRGDFTSPSGRIGIEIDHVAPAPPRLPRFQPPAERPRASARPRFPRRRRRARSTTSGSCRRSARTAQTWMWDRVEYDHAWRARTRWAWKGFKEKFPYTPELIAKGQAAREGGGRRDPRARRRSRVRPPALRAGAARQRGSAGAARRKAGTSSSATPGAPASTSTTCRLRRT